MTTPDTSGDIAVIKPDYIIEEAYRMGHDEFSDVEADSAEDVEFHYFTESARWANIILPRLRAMAGAADEMGVGTYTDHRDVAAIHSGCEEDEPAEADLISSKHVHGELVDAYRMGALDAVEETYDPESALHGVNL